MEQKMISEKTIIKKLALCRMYILLGTIEAKAKRITSFEDDNKMKELCEARGLDFKSFKDGAEQYTFEICDEIRDLIEQEIGMEEWK